MSAAENGIEFSHLEEAVTRLNEALAAYLPASVAAEKAYHEAKCLRAIELQKCDDLNEAQRKFDAAVSDLRAAAAPLASKWGDRGGAATT